jgi:ABC-type transport system involved in multi-copper enzyme maturation permease subunit
VGPLIGFAYITLKENVRRRSFYGVVIAYLLALAFSRVLMEFSLQDPSKVLTDFSYTFLVFLLFLTTLFISTDTMSKDIEKKGVYLILSKGVSRDLYLVGRSFGFLVFTLILTLTLGTLFLAGSWVLNTFSVEVFRKETILPAGLPILLSLWLKMFLVSLVVLFFSTFMSNFFLVFLASVVVLIAGSSLENLYRFIQLEGERFSPLMKHLITFLFYTLPNFSSPGPDALLGLEGIDPLYLSLDLLKALLYAGFLLSTSLLIFRRRELA